MHRGSQSASAVSSGQGSVPPNSQFHHDPRTPRGSGYSSGTTNISGRDRSVSNLTQMFSGMNLQGYRHKFGHKASATISNMDWSAANCNSYANPYFLYPSTGVYGSVPQLSSFVAGSVPSQVDVSQYQYMPTSVFPHVNSMVANNYHSWPYYVNYDMQDNKSNAWNTPDSQKSSHAENGGQVSFYPSPFMTPMDGTSMTGYPYGGMVPPFNSLTLPLQMMKTTSGYVVQDMEALTQQEPAIPRAVPAMWTNPSELTLAKCLENREGITNVYIRGFLPETTDEMLQAYAARFGKIERCKAIVDLDTGLCKGQVSIQMQHGPL